MRWRFVLKLAWLEEVRKSGDKKLRKFQIEDGNDLR